MVTVGSVVSRVTVMVSVEMFPEVSVARTVSTLEPPASATPATDQVPTPRVAAVKAPPLFDHSTAAMPTLSDTVPLSGSGVVAVTKVGFDVGPVIVTVGSVVSIVTVIVSVAVFPTESVAVTVRRFAPIASGTEASQLTTRVAFPEPPVRAFAHVTDERPFASEAVIVRAVGDALVE